MNKKMNITLGFQADTQQAKNQLAEFAKSLKNLQTEMRISEKTFGAGVSDSLKKTADDLYKVSAAYKSAINMDTGKLNISKFNLGLKETGTSISDIAKNFGGMGAAGIQAFSSLTKQIYNAEIPLKRTNKLIDDLWITLKNTAKWQLSSNVMHGFQGELQKAYGYAKDLNESLNNIRIVTGYNVDEMTKFAVEANKAAKELKTLTTTYTDASLIYYQQGLDEQSVKERTDITVKMANVTKDSGQEVADQMTAIWNNFDDGSKSLEYYADVLANLGAITASSTDEIAGGLEKFASVAETIGLSYEYAAASLATITATTRQSEDVVGTALKTIYARIQGLNLGETLDDGTTLNKYSEALDKVGISIFEQNGQMKTMDAILDEMGNKWERLSESQQVALAQTVAGVRQYNQIMSLMNNWDTMQENVQAARNSEGTLNTQQEIYAESWEAAEKNVKASMEGLFDTLINDEFFIDLFNGISDIVNITDKFIDSIGGVNSLLLVTAGLVSRIAKTKISDELFRLTSPGVEQQRQEIKNTQEEATKALADMSANAEKRGDRVTSATATTQGAVGKLTAQLNTKREDITDVQFDVYQQQIDQLETLGQIVIKNAQILQDSEEQLTVEQRQLELLSNRNEKLKEIKSTEKALKDLNNMSAHNDRVDAAFNIDEQLQNLGLQGLDSDELTTLVNGPNAQGFETIVSKINNSLQDYKKNLSSVSQELEIFKQKIALVGQYSDLNTLLDNDFDPKTIKDKLKEVVEALEQIDNEDDEVLKELKSLLEKDKLTADDLASSLEKVQSSLKGNFIKTTGLENATEEAEDFLNKTEDILPVQKQVKDGTDKLNESAEELGKGLDGIIPKTQSWQEGISNLGVGLTNTTSALFMAIELVKTLSNEDLSPWEKFNSVLMSLPMILSMSSIAFKGFKDAKIKDTMTNMLDAASEAYLAKKKNDTTKAIKNQSKELKTETNIQSKKTISESLSILRPVILPAIVSIIAAIGAIAIIKETEEWWNRNEAAAEKARESANQAAESYRKLKTTVDDLNTAYDGYQKGVEGLRDLTKGTTEYTEALIKANDEAYALIDKYDNLKYSVNSDGLIVIDEKSLEQAKELQLEQLELAQINSRQAEAQARIAQATANRTEFLRNDIKTNSPGIDEDVRRYGGTGFGTGGLVGLGAGLVGAKLGAGMGMWAGPLGAAIGAAAGLALGAVVGGIVDESETKQETEAMEKLAAAYRIEGEGIFADGRLEAILDDEKLSEALRANEQETRKLVAEMAEANRLAEEANRSEYEKKYGKYYEGIENEDVKQMAITQGSRSRQEIIEEFSWYFDNGRGFKIHDSDVQRMYQELMKDSGVTKVENLFNNKSKIHYADGTYQEVDDTYIRNQVAEAYLDKIIQNGIQGKDLIPDDFYGFTSDWASGMQLFKTRIEDAVGNIVQGSTFFAQSLEAAGLTDIIKFESNLQNPESMSIDFLRNELANNDQNVVIQDFAKKYEAILTPLAQAAEMTVEEYVSSLVNGFITTLDGQKNFAKEQLTQTTEDIFNNLVNSASGIETNQLDEIANQIQDAFIHGGEDKAQEIADLYADLGENADEFNGVLSTIDWNTIDLYSFKNLLIDNGIELDNVDDATLEYIIALEKLTASLEESTDTAYAKLAKLSKLNYGDIISDEEYKDLSDNVKSTLVRAPGGGWMVFDEERYKLYTSGESVDKYRQNVGSYQEGSYAALRGLVNGFYDNESLKEVVNIISSFGQKYLSNKDWQLFQGLAAEVNSGKELKDVDLTNFTRIAKTLYHDKRFNYQNIQQQIEEQENLVNEAIIDNLLAKYDLVREDIKNYDDPFEGIAQARFDRGIGEAVSFYEKGVNANDLSMDDFEKTQKAIADVLNINTSSVTREFINRLQSSGILKNIVSNQNFDNNIIQARDDLLKVISEEIASTFSDEEATLLNGLNKNSSKEKVEEVLSSLTNVKDEGLEAIISYFDLLGWEIGVGDDGNLYVKAQKSDASIFGSQILKEDDKQADKIDNVRLSETVERYKEITDSLNDLEDAYSDVSKQADRLYGADRLKKLKEQNEMLKQRQVLLKQEKKEAEAWLVIDRQALSTAFQDAGFELRIDEDTGNILNYTEVLTELNKQLNEQIDIRNKKTDKDEAENFEKEKIEPIKKQIEAIRELAGAYDETQQVIVDSQNKIVDAFNEWQDNNYQQLTLKIEVKFDIDDMEMREIERRIRDLGDEFTNMAEIASLLSTDKLSEIMDDRDVYNQENLDELTRMLENKEISQEDYVAQLKEMYNGIYDNIDALYDLDETMKHYYEDTLQKGATRLAEQTAGFDKLNSALDHYKNLITLVNGEYDYDSIGSILEGKADNLKNNLDVATSNYQMLLSERARIQQLVDNAQSEEERERREIELKAIEEQVDEAHAVMLDKTAEWAEAQKALMENIMEKAARDMEKAFTNGMGFDALNNSIQRVSSNSDEYLTKTNQIYETQKLMNTAQQAIDKTTNSAAKVRLKNYQDEIKALQDKNKLTNIEIELAKARYDVLLAEIALEEAQNAKSTVRLQRDNEGNFGYVYTADQAKVAEAEQNLLDTQNNLYNIRLDAANDYGQKIMDLNQQLADDLMALEKARTEGQYATEAEYQAAKDQILREYYDLYTTYSNIYALASAEDARIEQEAWVSAYNDIINNAENWQYYTALYTQQCENAYSTYRATVATESEIINQLLNGVQQSVSDITTESDKLATYIKDTLIPELQNEYKEVTSVTTAYLSQLTAIQNLKQGYDELAKSILDAMTQFNTFNGLDTTPPPPPSNTNPGELSSEEAHALAQKEVDRILASLSKDEEPNPNTSDDDLASEVDDIADELKRIAIKGAILNSLPHAIRYDTGGYTGEWGPAGRLAMLDEKELVLNKDDTENFLVATGILRSIVDLIDINSLHNQVSNLSSAGFAPLGGERLEQSVSIEAHFPSVSDRNEIEEAFNNLINTASQYANRKV